MIQWVAVLIISLVVFSFGAPQQNGLLGPVSLTSLPALEQGSDGVPLQFDYKLPLQRVTAKDSNLEKYQGKNLLIFYFSATCGHCKEAAPHILSIVKKYQTEGLNAVAISVKNNSNQDLADFLNNQKLDIPVYQDSQRMFSRKYGTGSVPVILLVNKEGNILKFRGFMVGKTGIKIRQALENKYLFD